VHSPLGCGPVFAKLAALRSLWLCNCRFKVQTVLVTRSQQFLQAGTIQTFTGGTEGMSEFAKATWMLWQHHHLVRQVECLGLVQARRPKRQRTAALQDAGATAETQDGAAVSRTPKHVFPLPGSAQFPPLAPV
jgi:hypothetical protein